VVCEVANQFFFVTLGHPSWSPLTIFPVAYPATRATDSDRNNTCQVLDTALSDGQLSTEEHRQRVSAATNATTLGELQSLVSDLQIERTPVQRPKLAGGWRMRIAVAVLLGAGIAWGLYGTTTSSKITSSPSTTPTTSSPAALTPRTPTAQTTTPTAPQLQTPSGMAGLLAQMRTKFGDAMGYELVVYPDYAELDRPDPANPHQSMHYHYGNDSWMNARTSSIPADSTAADLSKFNVQEVAGVLHGAPQSLNMTGANTIYLMIEGARDGTLALSIHVSDGSRGGSIELAADGTVQQINPPEH
jgi:Domain of unknown function (DUF1707)